MNLFSLPSGICLLCLPSFKNVAMPKASTKWLKLNRNSEWAKESLLFPIFCSNDLPPSSSLSWKMWLQHNYLYTVTPSTKAIPQISCNNCNAIERIEYAMHELCIYLNRRTLILILRTVAAFPLLHYFMNISLQRNIASCACGSAACCIHLHTFLRS